MRADLPMYDWPEIRAETDAFWSAMRDRLRDAGFDAPEALARAADPWAVWRGADLLLSQTCGLPFSARLSGTVSLVGAPAYDLACPPGFYRSEIIARADDSAGDVGALAGRRFAYNMRESQSGWAAFTTGIGDPAAWFAELVETGAHRASIKAVAEGEADAACIDAVAWRLAERWEPAAARVRVVASTAPTPGLPVITAKRPESETGRIAAAVGAAIGDLDGETRAALLLTGFARLTEDDYAPLAAGWPAD